MRFYYISLGSLTEIQNQLLIARDIDFMSEKDFDEVAKQAIEVSKVTNGLIKKSRSFIHNS